MIENRAVGIKSREVYEAPGAIALITAHSALEDVVLTKDEARLKRPLEQRWTEIVYEGRWFSPAREAIDAFVDSTQELVTGEVRLELRPNAAVVTGRRSPHLLYAAELASYGAGRDLPARGRRGVHQDLLSRDRTARGQGARDEPGIIRRVTTWAGESRERLTRMCGRFSAPTTRSSCRTTARRPPSTRDVLRPPGS